MALLALTVLVFSLSFGLPARFSSLPVSYASACTELQVRVAGTLLHCHTQLERDRGQR